MHDKKGWTTIEGFTVIISCYHYFNHLIFVTLKDGRKENVFFDKITSRVLKLCYGLNMDYIDPVKQQQQN